MQCSSHEQSKSHKPINENPAELIARKTGDWWQDDRRNWCAYCGRKLIWKTSPTGEKNASRDHVLPKSFGGGVTIPSCVGCNRAKANRGVAEFLNSGYFLQNRGKRSETQWPLRDLWLVMAMEAVLQAKRHSATWPNGKQPEHLP